MKIVNADEGNGFIFFVNMDNQFLIHELHKAKDEGGPWLSTGSNTAWCFPLSAFSKNSSDFNRKLERRMKRMVKRTSIWRELVGFVPGLLGSSFQ